MAIYEYTSDSIVPLNPTTFSEQRIGERSDLQRLLKHDIRLIDPDLFVLGEEFSEWEDSRRRIDLLAIDRDANIVVIELKRDNSGEHMDLQALRYAAMVSALQFRQAVESHAIYRTREGLEGDAEQAILDFLDWEAPQEDLFAGRVRIVLVSADFSKELTTSVLWLNEQKLDIRCFRLKPFKSGKRVFIEALQVIPLPEAAEYQVQLREKAEKEQQARESKSIFKRFWGALLPKLNQSSSLFANVNASGEQWITASVRGYQFNCYSRQFDGQVELYIINWSATENLARFNALRANAAAIEADFGGPLEWMELPGGKACRIRHLIDEGGYRSPERDWPAIHRAHAEAMARLERAVLTRLP